MRLKLSVAFTIDRNKAAEPEMPEPQPEGAFAQAELAGVDVESLRMPIGFYPPEGRA